ncbi:myosin-1B-like isoform X2 [Anopheles arabiensis]|nr:myosin-1B-like isoform X2 [Anopheles arabiensis]
MAENQSTKKEDPYWRRLVLRWCAELNPGQDCIALARCYDTFRSKVKRSYELREGTVIEFLREKFPNFELKLNRDNEIPDSDSVYVFSLMLYFSCVAHSIPYFQNIGLAFEEPFQHSIKAFLNSFVPENERKIIINRSFLDKAFLNAKRSVNVLRDQSSCGNIMNIHSQSKGDKLALSKPCGGNQETVERNPSPTKANGRTALEWKVKNLSNQLDATRVENSNQEKQIEQLLRNVQELQRDRKRAQAKIAALQQKEQPCKCATSTAEHAHRINRVTEQLQKQLESKSNCIELLQDEIAKSKDSASKELERCKAVKKQCASLKEDNQLLHMTVEALQEELALKDGINQNLTEAVADLRRFIRENRIHGAAGGMDSFESSCEFSEKSFRLATPDESVCSDSQNLAATVVDIKLKEKELENQELQKKVQELEDTLKQLYKAQADKQVQEGIVNEQLAELRKSLTEAETSRSTLADSLEREKARTEELTRQTEEWKGQQKRGAAELERLSALYEKKQCQYEQSQHDCDKLWVKLYKARSLLEENEKQWTQERTSLGKLFEDSMHVLEVKLHKAKVECQGQTEEIADRMKKQQEEITAKLESDKDGLRLKLEDYQKHIEELETQCTTLEKDLKESLKENQLMQNELKTAKEVSSARKSTIAQSTQTNMGTKLNFNSDKLFNNIEPEKNTNKRSVPSEPVALVSDVSKSQDTSGKCTTKATRRAQQPVNDSTKKISGRVGGRKDHQRKVLFDSNRNLVNSPPCQQDTVGVKNETIQRMSSNQESLSKPIVMPQRRSVDKLELVRAIAPINTTPKPTLTTISTTTTTLTTASTADPATSPVVRDYRFSQPYGNNRYNILRMQVQSRTKRRQLCDQTRRLSAKGRSNSLSTSIGSPGAVLSPLRDFSNDPEGCNDMTLYLCFTNEPDYDDRQEERARSSNTSLFLILIAYVGMLAQIFFFFGGLAIRSKRLKSGRT